MPQFAQHFRKRPFDRMAADDRRHSDDRPPRPPKRLAHARQRQDRIDADERIGWRDDDGVRLVERFAERR